MKKLSLILMVFSILFVSCNKDDDGGTQAEITGAWELNKYEVDGEGMFEVDGEQVPVTIEGYGENYNAQLILIDDTEPGTVTGNGSFDLIINFIYMGEVVNTIENTVSFDDMFPDATWVYNSSNNTLTINDGSIAPTVFNVTTLNNSTLVLEMLEIDEETSTSIALKITFTR